jgi:hypothetical protein
MDRFIFFSPKEHAYIYLYSRRTPNPDRRFGLLPKI